MKSILTPVEEDVLIHPVLETALRLGRLPGGHGGHPRDAAEHRR